MALNKKQISYLLVTVLMGGTIAIEGMGLYKLNQTVEGLQKNKSQLELKIDDLNKSIKEKDSTIKEKDNTIDNISKERDNNKDSADKLKKEVEVLNQKLESKIQKKESSAVQLVSAEYPTTKSRSSVGKGTPVTMRLSFYGDFAHENGGYAGMDAQGNKLVAGTIASNVHSFGTQFEMNGQIYTVRDRGGSHFNSSDRLDVFVPRLSGESDSAYAKRISNYGRKTVTMYKL